MNFLQDWKMWLFVVSLCQMGLMIYGFAIIKFNDLHHLSKDVTDIKTDVKDLTSKVINIDKDSAVQEQRLTDLEKSIG